MPQQLGKYSDADLASTPSASTAATPDPPPQSMLQRIGSGAVDLAKGVGEGALSTISSSDDWAAKHLPAWFTTPIGQEPTAANQAAALAKTKELATPTNTMQRIGKGAEQVGEFMLPTGVEEAGARAGAGALGKAGEILGRAAGSGLHSGAVNAAQGGSFGTGAAMGVAGSGVTQGLKAIAPTLAESALNVRGADRAYGATPGRAILDETTGFTPRKIIDSARQSLNNVQSQAGNAVANSPGSVDLTPARQILSDYVDRAELENHPGTTKDLTKLARQLDTYDASGKAIPQAVLPVQATALNRGISNAITSWNPALANDTMNAAGKMAHHSLGESIAQVVPEIKPLNQRMASLMPVIQRGNAAEQNANPLQRGIGRFKAHTGALTASGMGAGAGYEMGGLPGAILGGLGTLGATELLASPETWVAGARAANSPFTGRVAIPAAQGVATQVLRRIGQKDPDAQ